MATFSAKSNKRSISLSSRSHPATQNIEEELNKLKTWEFEFSASPTAEAVYNGLVGLGEVHKCIGDLLNLPLTLQALSQCQNKKWVDEILDKSVRFLDICGTTRELVSQFKENIKDVQSLLRRRKGDLNITNYTSFRKKMKKDAKSLITSLKKIDHEEGSNRSQEKVDVVEEQAAKVDVVENVKADSIHILRAFIAGIVVGAACMKINE
ncbi:hypothetical protein K7X08_019891 [Anisodus acutangulus]|uniref:Uncharacterized protein n=1 Tax=Anisodus acutangulus TaxID=402998 RepID=A0A9Q1MSR7_9SOLA|nr:hypothetical protein K7X08_019891 [Anisodus acutangulus]